MRRVNWQYLMLMMVVVATMSACAAAPPVLLKEVSGEGWAGRVIDASNGQPLPGALVWVRWYTYSPGHSSTPVCHHLDLTTTDADGRFRTEPWRRENPPHAYDELFHGTEVYMRGYGRTKSDSGVQIHPDLLMPPWVGTSEERLRELLGLLAQSSCGYGADNTKADRLTAAIHRAVLVEMEDIPAASAPRGGDLPYLQALKRLILKLERQPQ